MTTIDDELHDVRHDLAYARHEAEAYRRLRDEWMARAEKAEQQVFLVKALCDAEDARVAGVNERLANEGVKSLKTGRPFFVVGTLTTKRIRLALAGEQPAGYPYGQPETD